MSRGQYQATINGVTVRTADGVHLTRAGGAYIGERIKAQLVALGSVKRAAQARNTQANQAQAGPS